MVCETPYNPFAGCRKRARIWAAVVLTCCSLMLIRAATLDLSGDGVRPHEQLGVQRCMWQAQRGAPCPTCGFTTSVALAAQGRLWASLVVQPAGFVLAVLAAVAVWVSGWVVWSGSTAPGVVIAGWWRARTLAVVAVMMLAAWLYKLAVT